MCWIRGIAGEKIEFEWSSGAVSPKDIKEYAIIVHCGGCRSNKKEMPFRMNEAKKQGVFITNYGMLIAFVEGILLRALAFFPSARHALGEQINT